MNHWILLCLTVGLFWTGAPFLARLSQLSPWTMAGFVAIGTLLPTLPLLFLESYAQLTLRQTLLGILGGFSNGLGLLAWYKLVAGANQGLWNVGTVLSIAMVLVCVMLVVGGRIFFGEPLTTQRVLGLLLASAAIYFLR